MASIVQNSIPENESVLVTLPTDLAIVAYLLECPVCTEFMTSRVRLCSMGHSICSDCFTNLLQSKRGCPLCRKPLSTSAARNFFLENMAALCKFKCKYSDRGCGKELEGFMYEIHLRECRYRDFKCETFGIQQICPQYPLRFKDFIDHLVHDHEIPLVKNGSWIEKRFCVENETINPSLILIKSEDTTYFFHVTPFPKRFMTIQTIYQHLFMRWVMKADDEKEDASQNRKESFEIITKDDEAVTSSRSRLFAERPSLLNALEVPFNQRSSNMDTIIRSGPLLQLSQFPRDLGRWTKEDDNSLFGFSLHDSKPEIVWKEKVTIKKSSF